MAGMGTTGTLMGTGRYLKSVKPAVKIVGVEPVMGHTIQGLKNMTESMVPGIYRPEELDLKEMVEDGEAFETTKLLATRRKASSWARRRGGGGRGPAHRQEDRQRHDRGHPARPGRPLPQHHAVPVHLRQMPAVMPVSARR